VIKPEDLRGDARRMFDVWRSIGMSESATMEMLREDGLIPISERDRMVEFCKSMGLSPAEAEIAADCRDGPSPRLVPTSSKAVAEATVESRALVSTVRELAESTLRRGGVRPRPSETQDLAAVRESAWKVILRLPPTVAATMWAARVVQTAWPGVQLADPQRPSGSPSRGSSSKSVRS
jgi:hypothetical protein